MLTVIVPIYNSEKYLKRCVESIQEQTYSDLEILLIDDGSTDNSLQICNELAEHDNRLVVIHQENKGVSAARNNGLNSATGEYITFVDSDDSIEEDMYELLMSELIKYNADMAHCGYKRIENDTVKDVNGTHEIYIQTNAETINNMLSGKLYNCGLWNKVFKREVLNDLKFDEDIKINEDVLFCYNALQQAHKCVFIDETKYLYYVHDKSACNTTDSLRKLTDSIRASEIMLRNCKYDENKIVLEERLFYCYLRLNRWYVLCPSSSRDTQKENERNKLKELYNSMNNLSLRARINYYSIVYFSSIYKWFYKTYDRFRKPNWDVK